MTRLKRGLFQAAAWYEARKMPLLSRNMSLSELLAWADRESSLNLRGFEPDEIVRSVVKTTRRPWLMRRRRCLRQGVLAYRFLRASGRRPELHFGLDPASMHSPALRAHC